MLETVRAWLNGKKDYFTGVAIYAQVGTNSKLLEAFKKGATPFTTKRLGEELLSICNALKEQNNAAGINNNLERNIPGRTLQKIPAVPVGKTNESVPVNQALYETCRREADQQYKLVMNARAVLFASIHNNEDPNQEDKIKERAAAAIAIVEGFKKLSHLYDQAEYVKIHGHLPGSDSSDPENEYDALPDHLVKGALDNLRKNYNKMKKREATPERVALLQQHEKNLKKLETRWASLK